MLRRSHIPLPLIAALLQLNFGTCHETIINILQILFVSHRLLNVCIFCLLFDGRASDFLQLQFGQTLQVESFDLEASHSDSSWNAASYSITFGSSIAAMELWDFP
jgi:hypothetical protein